MTLLEPITRFFYRNWY